MDDTPKNRKIAETKIMPEIQYKLNSGEFFKKLIVPTVGEFAKKVLIYIKLIEKLLLLIG